MSISRTPGEWNLIVRQQAAIAHLGQVGLQRSEVGALIREALLVVADTLEVGTVGLFELTPDRASLRATAAIRGGRLVPEPSLPRLLIPADPTSSLLGYALAHGQIATSDDVLRDDRIRGFAARAGIEVRAAIAVPIGWSGRHHGALAVGFEGSREWTDDELNFVQSVASTLGLAMRRAQVEQELRDSTARLDLSLTVGGLGAWSWDMPGDRLSLNGSALAMFGLTTGEFGGTSGDFLALVHPEDRPRFLRDARRLLAAQLDQRHQFRIIRPDTGEVRWVEATGRPLGAGPGAEAHLVGVCSDVTERRQAEQLQQAILDSEHLARLDAERARERLSFLAEASAVLTDVLDPRVTLERLADLCVPRWADVCFVDVVEDDGDLAEVAGRGVEEGKLLDARALRRRRRELGKRAPTASGHLEALAGRGIVHQTIGDDQLVAASADPDHLALFRRLDPRSTVIAPMVARGVPIGVLTLIRTGGAEPFSEDEDLLLFEDLASRAALAVENGRLFAARNRVARSLQDALLPPAMPQIAGLDLAARYQVADADVEIGGDFYDVIRVGPATWGLVVGDVCGRGPDAAALTGLVRHTLRTAVLNHDAPSVALHQTNEAMLQQIDEARFCTAAYLRVELTGGVARVAASSAGHPRPALVRADGTVELLECGGTLLGVVPDPELVDLEVELAPGDAVVLYTDGVTEAREGTAQFGDGRLVETLAGLGGRSADEIASGLEEAVASFRGPAHDDTAILVARASSRP